MAANGAEIIQRYNRLKQNRANFDARWEEMAPYIAPSRVGITSQPSPGEKQTRNVYDSSTMMAAEMMAMFIAGHIINPAQQWFEFKLRDPVVGKMDSGFKGKRIILLWPLWKLNFEEDIRGSCGVYKSYVSVE